MKPSEIALVCGSAAAALLVVTYVILAMLGCSQTTAPQSLKMQPLSNKARFSSERLNSTLETAAQHLHDYGFQNWFIFYGTLLGIVRSGSCIDGDDDVDIVIDEQEREALKQVARALGWKVHWLGSKFCQVKFDKTCAPVDFYFASINAQRDYYVKHEHVWIQDPHPYQVLPWRNVKLHLPYQGSVKLHKLYGPLWKILQDNKGIKHVQEL